MVINKPAEFYVNELDELIARDPYSGNYKIGVLFKTIAVMEHDFDEGIDKELTAKRWLGPLCPLLKESQKGSKQR